MHELVYPLPYKLDRQPVLGAFSMQLDEVRSEWRQRKGVAQSEAVYWATQLTRNAVLSTAESAQIARPVLVTAAI